MTSKTKQIVRRLFRLAGLDIRKLPAGAYKETTYSNLGEQSLIRQLIDVLNIEQKFCVDIGASNGVSMSNTYALYRQGWQGLAVEYDPQRFSILASVYESLPSVNLARCMVTPLNVNSVLEANSVPERFGLLSLDIDGYDYFVIEQILRKYRPTLICAEINEKIPPPIRFTVKWDPGYAWKGDHFYGQSISQVYQLCLTYDYALIELHYNNVFLVPTECNPRPSLSPEVAYQEGYKNKPDRKEKFPWNANVEPWLSLEPETALAQIVQFYDAYADEFEVAI